MTRSTPCGCVVWGPSGAGKGHLVRAAGHLLYRKNYVSSVRHLQAARLACGRVFPSERDETLSTLLDELVDRPRLLLLVDHMDLGVSGSAASLSLLAGAFARGARILATVADECFLKRIREIDFLARRLLPIRVPPLSSEDTRQALRYLVRTSRCEVTATALSAAVEITERKGASQPGAAIDLLSTAIAEANWRHHKRITPDDVTSVLEPDWPR